MVAALLPTSTQDFAPSPTHTPLLPTTSALAQSFSPDIVTSSFSNTDNTTSDPASSGPTPFPHLAASYWTFLIVAGVLSLIILICLARRKLRSACASANRRPISTYPRPIPESSNPHNVGLVAFDPEVSIARILGGIRLEEGSYQTARVRHIRRREEGLDEHGEAPPPYVPAEHGGSGSGSGGSDSEGVEMQGLGKPPDYEAAKNGEVRGMHAGRPVPTIRVVAADAVDDEGVVAGNGLNVGQAAEIVGAGGGGTAIGVAVGGHAAEIQSAGGTWTAIGVAM